MTRRHLILWIRYTELALALFILSWLLPRPFDFLPWMLAPVALMMPVLGTPTACSSECTAVPLSASITVGSIANGSCADCTNHNLTTVVNFPLLGGIRQCLASGSDGASGCFFAGGGGEVFASFTGSAGSTYIVADFTLNSGFPGFTEEHLVASASLGSSPVDCSAAGTPSLTVTTRVGVQCDMSGATISVTV